MSRNTLQIWFHRDVFGFFSSHLLKSKLFKGLILTPAPSLMPNLDEAQLIWTLFQQWKHLPLTTSPLYSLLLRLWTPHRTGKEGIPCSSLRCCSATPTPSQELNATGSVKIFWVDYITVVEGTGPLMRCQGSDNSDNEWRVWGGMCAVNNGEEFPCGFCVCLRWRLFSLCCVSESGVCFVCCTERTTKFIESLCVCDDFSAELLVRALKIWYDQASCLSALRFLSRMPSCYTTASCQADTLEHSRRRVGKTAVIRVLKESPAENTHWDIQRGNST